MPFLSEVGQGGALTSTITCIPIATKPYPRSFCSCHLIFVFLQFLFWRPSVRPKRLSAHMGFLLVRLFGPCACSRMGWASCLCCCCPARRPGGRALGRRVRLAVLLCPSSGIAGFGYRIALWAEYWLKCDLVFNLQHKRKLDPVGSEVFREKSEDKGERNTTAILHETTYIVGVSSK